MTSPGSILSVLETGYNDLASVKDADLETASPTTGTGTTGKAINASGVPSISNLINNLLMRSLSGSLSQYNQIGQASDVSQINPFTNTLMSRLFGAGPGGSQGAFGTALGAAQSSPYSASIEAILSGDATNQTAANAFGVADIAGQGAVQDVANLFSSGNSLYSGAAAGTAAQRSTEARNASLFNTLGTLGGLDQQNTSSGQSFLSNILGLGTSLSGPEFYTPAYAGNSLFTSPLDVFALEQGVAANKNSVIQGGISTGISALAALTGLGDK